jgi:hypothetical protein
MIASTALGFGVEGLPGLAGDGSQAGVGGQPVAVDEAVPSPISARIRDPVCVPMPGRLASSSPKGWLRKASSISAAKAARRAKARATCRCYWRR